MAKRMSKVAMKAESPIVKAGKMMWKEMVKANCRRARSEASRCIRASLRALRRMGLPTISGAAAYRCREGEPQGEARTLSRPIGTSELDHSRITQAGAAAD